MPRCSLDDIAKTPTDTPYPLSFPILSVWPNLPIYLAGFRRPAAQGVVSTVLALVQQGLDSPEHAEFAASPRQPGCESQQAG